MKQYLDVLRDVYENGTDVDTRNGATRKAFVKQMRFNLEEGFPAVTTKKLAFKAVKGELLWFLSMGISGHRADDNELKKIMGTERTIWSPNSEADYWKEKALFHGDLGRIYGMNWRDWGGYMPENITQPIPHIPGDYEPTYLGVANGSGSSTHPLGKTWEGMISRCYNVNDIGYCNYGKRGVHVVNEWLVFKNFAQDATQLPGWREKVIDSRYVLDKDGRGNGFTYGPQTCQWVSPEENARLKDDRVFTVRRVADGKVFEFTNSSAFCAEHSVEAKNFSDLWTGGKNARVRSGFEFVRFTRRRRSIDQLADVIERIKKDPNDRRLIVTAWNPGELDQMALPPCHMMFQFFVADGKLSLHMYQRSCDMFLGVPFNIASYGLLLSMVAQVTGLTPHELILTLGDAHIYHDHFDAVKEQLSRVPLPLPTLWLNPEVRDIDSFKMDDIKLENYRHHDIIAATMAV